MEHDYYLVLGVSRTADETAIKKAYKELSRQYHPDRNPGDKEAEDKFKEVQTAYEVLGDIDKKIPYDRKLATPQPVSFTSSNLQDLFDMFFTQRPRQKGWGQHIEMDIEIDFVEAAKGCTKTVEIDKREVCRSCNGTMAKEFQPCVLCDGRGKTKIHPKLGFQENTCQSCQGTGKTIGVFCPDCNALGFHIRTTTLAIKIPAGINDGMKICARGEGDIGISGRGDLTCKIQVKSHPLFKRDGIHLLLKFPITYTQAVLGSEVDIPCLDGFHKLKIPASTKAGTVFRIPGLGLQLPGDYESSKGDLLVKVIIDMPEEISEEYKEVLTKVAGFESAFPGESKKNFNSNLSECIK
jgi:molecular chaperone DnaJ